VLTKRDLLGADPQTPPARVDQPHPPPTALVLSAKGDYLAVVSQSAENRLLQLFDPNDGHELPVLPGAGSWETDRLRRNPETAEPPMIL
jgi:hypothetical protein